MTRSTQAYQGGYIETNPGSTDLDKLLQNFGPLLDAAPPSCQAAADPGAGDDSAGTAGQGTFFVFSKWLNTASGALWICTDATPTAAVWTRYRGPAGPAGADGATGPAGAAGPAGVAGANGATGATGAAGPNLVNGTTATTLTGLLKGDGATVGAATADTDYLTPTGDGSGLSGVLGTDGGTISTSTDGSGTLTATCFCGDGSQLVNLPGPAALNCSAPSSLDHGLIATDGAGDLTMAGNLSASSYASTGADTFWVDSYLYTDPPLNEMYGFTYLGMAVSNSSGWSGSGLVLANTFGGGSRVAGISFSDDTLWFCSVLDDQRWVGISGDGCYDFLQQGSLGTGFLNVNNVAHIGTPYDDGSGAALQVAGSIRVTGYAETGSEPEGMIYYDTVHHRLRVMTNAGWKTATLS